MKTNTFLKIVCAPMVNAVLFGIGIVAVMSTPALNAQAVYLIPAVVVLSFVATYLMTGYVVRRMRAS